MPGWQGRNGRSRGGNHGPLPYSEAAARKPAISMVNATANQMSSTGAEIMGGGLGLGEVWNSLLSVPRGRSGSSLSSGVEQKNPRAIRPPLGLKTQVYMPKIQVYTMT
jgi:hypothetical protein